MSIWTESMASMTGRIFVDANVLLEIVHERDNLEVAIGFVRKNAGQLFVSALTVHLVMYFGRKVASSEALKQLLSDYYITSIATEHVEWAFANVEHGDFEDALQVASALSAECTQFATFDRALARRYRDVRGIEFVIPA